MGMTFWIHTLEDRNYSKDSDDHSLMLQNADALDALCDAVGVRKLSEFIDFTDQLYLYDEAGDEHAELDAEPELDPETELIYGIDDMAWFPAADGLATLTALRQGLERSAPPEVGAAELASLIEELDDCIAVVSGPAARDGKFHLALVE